MNLPFKLEAKLIIKVIITCAAYVVTARLGLDVGSVNSFASLVWPPTGVALAAAVLWGYEMIPGVLLGAFITAFIDGASPPLALLMSLGSAAEVFAGTYLLREQFNFDPMLRRLVDAASLVIVAFSTTLIAATVDALALRLFNVIGTMDFGQVWLSFWMGGALGILVFGPFLLRWGYKPFFRRTNREWLEGVGIFTLLIVVNVMTEWLQIGQIDGISTVYFLLVPLGWAALRAGPRGTTLALLVMALSFIFSAVFGYSNYTQSASTIFSIEIFLGVLTILFLLLVAAVEERKEAVVIMRQQIGRLDDVIERLRLADEAKSEFIATLAHELRNPLSPIVSSLELLRRGTVLPENQKIFATIEAHVTLISRLLDDLLDVSRISRKKFKLKKETVEFGTIVKRSAETVASFYESRKHTLEVHLPLGAVWLPADPVRLEQIVVNLLFNAGKYTEPGGHITLTVTSAKNRLRISVKDTGIGLSPDMLERIFEPFVQDVSTSRRMGGTGLGLGLALTKRLVELHGGNIFARSDGPGRGSEFIVDLPIPAYVQLPFAMPKPEVAAPLLNGNSNGERQRVLVVDDNEAAANALGNLLQQAEHHIELAYSGGGALSAAKEFEPDVVLLDIGLPDIDGYEVAMRLKAENANLAIIAITGWGQDSDKEKARAAGIDYHLTKPVGIAEVERLLLRVRRGRERSVKAALNQTNNR